MWAPDFWAPFNRFSGREEKMANSHLSLTLSIMMSLTSGLAWSEQLATSALPKPEQTPAPSNPGVREIPPPKAPPPAAPKAAAPAMPTHIAPVMAPKRSAPLNPKVILQRYADGLAIVLLNLSSYNVPNAEQKNRLSIALNSLKGIAYEVQPLLATNANDPIMRYVSLDLPQQFSRLEAAINAGTWSYARYLLRQVTHYTIPWQKGPSSKRLLQFPEAPTSVSQLEKAEYYAAIKRFDESMLAYEQVSNDRQFRQTQPETWEMAVENLMAITIRVRNDAHIALEISSSLREESSSYPAQKEMLLSWRKSAKAWTSENIGQKPTGTALLNKAQQIFDKGTQLSSQGRKLGTIEYLRTMALLHELAMAQDTDTLKAKAFQLSGRTGEKLRHVFIWMPPDSYYEACIRVRPHSTESRECLKLLESLQPQLKDIAPDRDKLKQLTELAR
jgi:hypothetical protein